MATFISIVVIAFCVLILTALIIVCIDLFAEGKYSFVYKFIAGHTKLGYNDEQEYDIPLSYRYGRVAETKKVKDFPTISFNQFKDFYYLNQNSWTLKDCRVYKNNDNNLSFTFTYPDYKKYKKFKKQLEDDEKNRAANKKMQDDLMYQNETTRKILEEVQKDIDRVRAESQKGFDEAAELIKGVRV